MTPHQKVDSAILSHYEQGYREEQRLQRESGRLEFIRTFELLHRYLPPAPAVLLDIGGGAGAYALALAREGYEVHLLDPVPRHVALATQASAGQPDAPLASVAIGDARELEYSDESADAVLLLGPLYHLTERSERMRVLKEALRVLRARGVVFGAAISRFASTYDGLFHGFMEEPEFRKIAARDVREGQHRNPTGRPEWFTTAYFHLPEELGEEVVDSGFELTGVFAVEGPGWFVPDLDNKLDDKDRRNVLLEAIRRVEQEPSVLGASPHLLAVGHC